MHMQYAELNLKIKNKKRKNYFLPQATKPITIK